MFSTNNSRDRTIARLRTVAERAEKAIELAESLPEWWEIPTFIDNNITKTLFTEKHICHQLTEETESAP